MDPIGKNSVKAYELATLKTKQSQPEDKVLQTYLTTEVFEFMFNQPKKLNAIDNDVVMTIHSALDQWNK